MSWFVLVKVMASTHGVLPRHLVNHEKHEWAKTITIFAAIGKSLVVDVHQYGILKPDGTEFSDYDAAVGAFGNDPQSVAFCLRTPAGECANIWSNCGTNAGCKKQHKRTNRLSGLREPAGFRMATPRRGKVRAARKQDNQAPLLYLLSTGVLQQIWQNLGALDVA